MRPDVLASNINKLLGPGTIRLGNDASFTTSNIKTGIVPIDYILRGGLPRNRITQIWGDYSTLKTYIALKAVAQTQRGGGTAAFVDAEHSYDPEWASSLGVNVSSLHLVQPSNGEIGIDAADLLIRNKTDLLVVDSIAALLPKAEEETQLSRKNPQMARQAALMSIGLRKLTAANDKTAVLFLNQTRMNVGITFGNPETVPGGRAIGFYSSWIISLKKAGRVTKDIKIFDGDKDRTVKLTVAQRIRASVEKSKLDRPYNEVFFDYDLNSASVDDVGFLINLGIERGVVMRKGQMWAVKGGQPVRGLAKFKETADKNKLMNLLGLNGNQKPRRSGAGALSRRYSKR